MVNQEYENTIRRASRCHNPADALKLLDRFMAGSGRSIRPESLPQPGPRYAQKLLAGILLQAGYVAEASRVLAETSAVSSPGSVDALIVDPGFVHLEGHHYNSNVFYKRMVEHAGLSIAVLRMMRPHPSFQYDDTGSIPTFVLSPYERQFFSNLNLPQSEALRLLNELFFYEFQRALPQDSTRLLLVPVARHTFIEGFCRYLQADNRRSQSAVLLGVVETDGVATDHPMHALVREIYSRSFRILRSLPDLKLLVLVETAEVAQFLSDIAGPWLQIIILPYVAGYLDEIHTTRKEGRATRPVVGYVGQTRPERGALLIPEIAKKTLLAYPNSLAWRVQLNLDVIRRQVSQDLDGTLDWLAKSPAFEFVGSNLPIADYYNLLASIDIMVMPYSDRYNFTGSGIGVESLRLGHVQVVPERSSMARMIAAYQAGAVTFPEATVEKVTSSVIEALERFDELRERCMHAAKTAQAESGALFQLERFIQDA